MPLPKQLTHSLAGTAAGSLLGGLGGFASGIGSDDPEASKRRAMKGAVGGGAAGGMYGLFHGNQATKIDRLDALTTGFTEHLDHLTAAASQADRLYRTAFYDHKFTPPGHPDYEAKKRAMEAALDYSAKASAAVTARTLEHRDSLRKFSAMNPQDILNSQYSAPDMPDVSQVRQAVHDVVQHFRDHKGHAALLAASLPVVGYGGYRALRKTPEADPEPSLHTQQATVEMPQIQQGSDKIALEVMAAFGLRDMLHMDRLAAGAHPALPPGLPPAVARISSIPAIAQKWVQEQARLVPKALAPRPVQRPVPGVSSEVLARFGLC